MSSVRFASLLFLVALPAAASAQSMNADTFHRRAAALMKKGPLALFARGEIKALMQEGKASGLKAAQARRATIAAGGSPRFCPPAGQVSMGSDEFMKKLSTIPRAERARIDMTEATTRIMATKFPCKA